MPPTHSIVISASRRTDIPAFFMPWFMQGIARGAFEVTHPFTRRVSRVVATTPPVHTIVFWSKNFGPFLEGGYGLIFSFLFAWVHFLNWAKYWEMVKDRIKD